jgi:Flp pilus assembly protein TadD
MSASKRSRNKQRYAAGEHAPVGARVGVIGALLAPSAKRNWILCLLLAIGTFALYSPVLGHPFIFNYDDDTYVLNNPHVSAGLTWATFIWAVKSTEYSNWHPLTWLSHALDCQLYGLNPTGHHLTSVSIHVLNVVLLFLLLTRSTGATGRSLIVAALFAVHPFNVESVAWVAERKSVLCTLFFLLALGAYGWYARKPSVKRYGLVAAMFLLALAAKPMAITLPFALLLLDFWPLSRIKGWAEPPPDPAEIDQASLLRLVAEKVPLLVLSAASGFVTVVASRQYNSMHLILPLRFRLGNAVCSYAMYLWRGVWPGRLAVFYPHPGTALAAWKVALAAVFLAGVSALVWRMRAARPYLMTGWLWYLGILVPAIGLVQVGEQAMADRYAYIPLVGIFVMAVWGFADWADSKQLGFRKQAWVAAIILALLGIFTGDQIRYWKSADVLWLHAVNVTKDNFTADENLSAALMATDRADEAVPYLQDAVRLRPRDPAAHLNLAAAFALSSRSRDAIREYEVGLPLATDRMSLAGPYETLGRLYEQLGNYAMAIPNYEQSLSIDPQRASARDRLTRAEFSQAIRDAAETPSGQSYFRLGQLMQQAGRVSDARSEYQHALKLDPKLSAARTALDSLK